MIDQFMAYVSVCLLGVTVAMIWIMFYQLCLKSPKGGKK